MAFHASSDESFDEPWNGRSTPTTRVLLVVVLVVPPPPHPVAAKATTANAPITLIRLFMQFLSLLFAPVTFRRP